MEQKITLYQAAKLSSNILYKNILEDNTVTITYNEVYKYLPFTEIAGGRACYTCEVDHFGPCSNPIPRNRNIGRKIPE